MKTFGAVMSLNLKMKRTSSRVQESKVTLDQSKRCLLEDFKDAPTEESTLPIHLPMSQAKSSSEAKPFPTDWQSSLGPKKSVLRAQGPRSKSHDGGTKRQPKTRNQKISGKPKGGSRILRKIVNSSPTLKRLVTSRERKQ